MKKFILMLMLSFTGVLFSQNKEFFSDSDFENIGGTVSVLGKKILLMDGNSNQIEGRISFMSSPLAFEIVSVDDLNAIIHKSLIETQFQLKNKSTFSPKSIVVNYDDKQSEWGVSIRYTAQNDFGAIKDGTSRSTFDSIGNYKNTVSF